MISKAFLIYCTYLWVLSKILCERVISTWERSGNKEKHFKACIYVHRCFSTQNPDDLFTLILFPQKLFMFAWPGYSYNLSTILFLTCMPLKWKTIGSAFTAVRILLAIKCRLKFQESTFYYLREWKILYDFIICISILFVDYDICCPYMTLFISKTGNCSINDFSSWLNHVGVYLAFILIFLSEDKTVFFLLQLYNHSSNRTIK